MKNEKRIFIGGEKVFPISIFFSKNKNNIFSDYKKEFKDYFINYTFGGHSSLLAIIDDLNIIKDNEIVLLPSYLCKTILKPFDERGVKYIFYKVDQNLTPDFLHIIELLTTKVKAILFIDYMGKSQIENIFPHQSLLFKKNIKIIQDSVQTIDFRKEQLYGDYAFNSLRKISPFEGSIIVSKNKMQINYSKGVNYKFVFNKRVGQILRYFHIHYNLFKPQFFIKYIEKAEKNYNANKIYKLHKTNKFLIRKVNFKDLIDQHRKSYDILLDNFHVLTPKYLQINDFTPFGFFMLIKDRNNVIIDLSVKGIYCPIHWILPEIIKKTDFEDSSTIAEKAITIPLSGLNTTEINYFLETFKKINYETIS